MTDDTTQLPFLITLGEQLAERAARDEERQERRGRLGRWADRRRREMRARSLALGGAGVIALAAAAVALTTDLGGDGGPVVTPARASAGAVLNQAARTAGSQPSTMPGPRQLFFVRSFMTRNQILGATRSVANTRVVMFDRRIWTSPSRPGRLLETPVSIRPLAGGPPTPIRRDGRGRTLPPQGTYRLGNLKLTRAELLRFPTEPDAIVARFRAAQPRVTDVSLFDQLGDALRESPAPPAVRAGLYRAMATLPGVQLVGPTRDERQRPGIAVGYRDGGYRRDLIIDTRSAEMLAERSVLVDPAITGDDVPRGTITSSTTYLRRAAVDTTADQ